MEPVKSAHLLTFDEVAELLRKSPSALRWMIHAGTAPRSGRIGGRVMFREEVVRQFIEDAFTEDAK